MATLLLAETFEGGLVHEAEFKRPVRVSAFRVVAEGEVPHPEIGFQGQTPAVPFALELYGAVRGKGTLCAALLPEPYRHDASATTTQMLPAEGVYDYLVIR